MRNGRRRACRRLRFRLRLGGDGVHDDVARRSSGVQDDVPPHDAAAWTAKLHPGLCVVVPGGAGELRHGSFGMRRRLYITRRSGEPVSRHLRSRARRLCASRDRDGEDLRRELPGPRRPRRVRAQLSLDGQDGPRRLPIQLRGLHPSLLRLAGRRLPRRRVLSLSRDGRGPRAPRARGPASARWQRSSRPHPRRPRERRARCPR